MKTFLLLVFSMLLTLSCSRSSDYEGYSKSRKGFYYQLKTIGESTQNIKIGDYVTADINYSTIEDSVFFEARRKIKIEEPSYKGAIEDCFMIMCEDESASFILKTAPFFKNTLETDLPDFIDPEGFFKVNISVIEVQTEVEYEKEKQGFLYWIEDFGDYEKVILQQYLAEEQLSVTPTESGLLYFPLVNNEEGSKIEVGDTISIDYEGIFLNGKYFDSTKRRNQAFQFVYGTEWQVIKGIEEGLSFMREGEKALFIVPSNLAFGAKGSSTGIVPPFTSLVFKVDVLSVKKGEHKQ